MTKEFRYFSYLKLDSSVVTSCTRLTENEKFLLRTSPERPVRAWVLELYQQNKRNVRTLNWLLH